MEESDGMAFVNWKDRPIRLAILRGAMGRCPNCGRGPLLRRYLKTVDRCCACAEPYGHLRADDAPPWMTILIVGHIVVPAMLYVDRRFEPALWVEQVIWPLTALLLALLILPRSKGVVLAILWATKGEGSERPQE